MERTLFDGEPRYNPNLRPSPATPPYHTKCQMFLSTAKGRDTPKDTPARSVPSAARLPAWVPLRLYYMRMGAQELKMAEPQFARGGSGGRTETLVAREVWRVSEQEPVRIPKTVLEELESVRRYSRAEVLDIPTIRQVAMETHKPALVVWIDKHEQEYGQGLLNGFQAED
jgi:hypothetical protein